MKEPLDPPRAPDEPDAPLEEEGRCNTRALDLGAVRAIHRAAQGAGLSTSKAAAGVSDEPASFARPPERPERTTLEVDYSPASRVRRDRSLRVQRAARGVVLVAVAACLGLGAWVLWARHREAPQASPLEAEPAETRAAAVITTSAAALAPGSSPPPSAPRPAAPEQSAVEVAPQASSAPAGVTTPPPRRPPQGTPSKRKSPPAPTSEFPNQ